MAPLADAPDPLAIAEARDLLQSDLPRMLRVGAGVTLREMAAWCGTSQSAIYRWETRQRVPRGPAAVRYLDVLQRLGDRALARAGL